MKKQLSTIVRLVVSVGILAYLFNSIFQNELKEVARFILQTPQATAAELAEQLEISAEKVALIRAKVQLVPDPNDPKHVEVNLVTLAAQERRALVWSVGPQSLWRVFHKVSPWWMAAAIGCVGIVCLCGILRWQWILRVQGIELSFPRATSIFFIGMFFNAFMLGSTGGDVIKAWYAARETHHKKAEAVATVVVDRLIGLMALFVITLIMMALFYHRVFDDVRLRGFAVVTVGVVLATVAGTLAMFWRGLADKLPRVRALLQKLPHYATLKRMIDAYRTYASHPALLLKTMLISFGAHLAVMVSIYCVGRGLGIVTANGLIDYLLYLPIINSVTAIPISISGFGVRELMYAEMFGAVGVTGSAAVALSLLGFIVMLFWSMVGSLFYLTHRHEVAAAEHEAATAE